MLLGREAPDFRAVACMPNDSFAELRLSDLRGKKYTVLLFYTADFTFVDASELVAFSNAINDFEKRNAQVIAISTESQFAHRGWRNTAKASGGIEKIAYPMVSDVSKQICEAYDMLGESAMAYHGTFIIDKGGIVRFEMVNDMSIGRSTDECLRVLDALQHHEATGRVLPVNWTKGKPDMAGTPEGVAEYMSKYLT
eukprot:TRINITY_DN65670_c0_g1_i1.p1 TRINITY_DN65670_c0_g1~~TRINITY_DN65670_c0_g1_i1.p1  ORF type:complete len:225 (+),score=43.77 TRINITY_DN65670_c0_g1_i1:88-675(+)